MRAFKHSSFLSLFSVAVVFALGCDSAKPAPDTGPVPVVDAGGDAGVASDSGAPSDDARTPADTGPAVPAPTTHCSYEPALATGGTGGTVTEGPLRAGTAIVRLPLPVGSALGAYTGRSIGFGNSGRIDTRFVEYAGAFNGSVGIETYPRVRALALSAGGETVVILKTDIAYAYEGITIEVERQLGEAYHGKVLFTTSHSHSQLSHHSANWALQLGSSSFRRQAFDTIVATLVDASRRAVANLRDARFGLYHDTDFDPADRVSRDRRGDNDQLPGGNQKDKNLYVLRVDAMDGSPIALAAIFGIHGTILDADNPYASVDAPGYIERALEESFDSDVLVMHLQGAGGDVSPSGAGDLVDDGRDAFLRAEAVGRRAVAEIREAYTMAGSGMVSATKLEMLTRSIALGPNWDTFSIRDGGLQYAPFDVRRARPDGVIYRDDAGTVATPIDEFNAPFGAGLCGSGSVPLRGFGIAGTSNLPQYAQCARVDLVGETIAGILGEEAPPWPTCQSTRTLVSALRLGPYVFPILPGEMTVILADRIRNVLSPAGAQNTIVLAYAQGHVGYILSPEDWLAGGYEPSINLWGPLEGEYLAEQASDLLRLALTDERENGNAGPRAVNPWTPPATTATFPPDAAPMSGTVPATVPPNVFWRLNNMSARPLMQGQPAAQVQRLQSVFFTFIGPDPLRGTPLVRLQRETAPGTFVDVVRRSGKPVEDGDLILTWTPVPFDPSMPQTHYWNVEWQAVTPFGTAGLDALGDVFGAPLGRYRFHAEVPLDNGTNRALDSNAFEVVAAPLQLQNVMRTATSVVVDIGYEARDGFRLLDFDVPSNRRVPARTAAVRLRVTPTGGGADTTVTATTDANGRATFAVVPSTIQSAVVLDRFDNSAPLP